MRVKKRESEYRKEQKVSISPSVSVTEADSSRLQEAERQLAHSFLPPSLIHAPAGWLLAGMSMQIHAVNELVLQGMAAQSAWPYDTHTHTQIHTHIHKLVHKTVGMYSPSLFDKNILIWQVFWSPTPITSLSRWETERDGERREGENVKRRGEQSVHVGFIWVLRLSGFCRFVDRHWGRLWIYRIKLLGCFRFGLHLKLTSGSNRIQILYENVQLVTHGHVFIIRG